MKKILIALLAALTVALNPHVAIAKDNDIHASETAQEACIEYGEQYGIEPELLMAIIETESGGKANAKNNGCYGLMQISKKWHKDRMERLGVTDLFDERSNILVGADLLADLIEKYGSVEAALMAYHGEKNVRQKAKQRKISKYAKRILKRSEELKEEMDYVYITVLVRSGNYNSNRICSTYCIRNLFEYKR